MDVAEAVVGRRSIRAFRDTPVDLAQLRALVALAGRAPSGGNLQPWHIHVVSGDALARLKALMARRVVEAPLGEGAEYPIYPAKLDEPYRSRRQQNGADYYAALGIARADGAARQAAFAANFQFFGAPVGLFCHVDRGHGPPQWSDCGMYLQTLMLLLREAGLDSCAQEAWALYPKTVDAFLGVPAEWMLFTGMAIGWADTDAPVNRWPVARAPLGEIATFLA